MRGLQDILIFYTRHDNGRRCIGYFHRSYNRIGIGTDKVERRPFKRHLIVIGTEKVNMRQVADFHVQVSGICPFIKLNSSATDEFITACSYYISWIYSVLTSTAAANNMGSSTKSRFVLEPRVVTKVPI